MVLYRPIHTDVFTLHLHFTRPPWNPFLIGCRFTSRAKPGEQPTRNEVWRRLEDQPWRTAMNPCNLIRHSYILFAMFASIPCLCAAQALAADPVVHGVRATTNGPSITVRYADLDLSRVAGPRRSISASRARPAPSVETRGAGSRSSTSGRAATGVRSPTPSSR